MSHPFVDSRSSGTLAVQFQAIFPETCGHPHQDQFFFVLLRQLVPWKTFHFFFGAVFVPRDNGRDPTRFAGRCWQYYRVYRVFFCFFFVCWRMVVPGTRDRELRPGPRPFSASAASRPAAPRVRCPQSWSGSWWRPDPCGHPTAKNDNKKKVSFFFSKEKTAIFFIKIGKTR